MKVLNFQERNEFLDEVVKACTIDGDYQPALLDVVFRLTILKYFADYDYRSEPQSEWPRIAYESFNFKINKAGCDTSAFWDQYDSLEKAVHEQIDRSHKEWLVLGLCGKLNEIIKKPDPISDFVDFKAENIVSNVSRDGNVISLIVKDIAKPELSVFLTDSTDRSEVQYGIDKRNGLNDDPRAVNIGFNDEEDEAVGGTMFANWIEHGLWMDLAYYFKNGKAKMKRPKREFIKPVQLEAAMIVKTALHGL